MSGVLRLFDRIFLPRRGSRLVVIVLIFGAAALLPGSLSAQDAAVPADSTVSLEPQDGLAIGLTRVPYIWPFDLSRALAFARRDSRLPGQLASEWLTERTETEDLRLAARRDTLWMVFLPIDKLPSDFDTRRFFEVPDAQEDELAGRRVEQRVQLLPDVLEGLADLDLEFNGTGQIGTRWQTFDPCTLGTGQRCNASAKPTIRPEFQLRALAKGTISERVHLDVDFDQTREFGATNNINVFYEGRPGEVLEFVELGEVTLPLPRSQFISRAIPAGNFGIRTEARFGPLTLRGVIAEQDGSIQTRRLSLDVGGVQDGVIRDFETVLDDVGFADGQFFFLVDPREYPSYPHIDVTSLTGSEVPLSLQPGSALKLYRHEIRTGQPQNVEDGIIQARAVALRPLAADPTLPDSAEFQGFFRPLTEGEDYIVHDSGLWIVMKSRILENEALAATYITATGDTIGDFNAEEIFREISNTGSGELPELVLLKDPATHRPGGITWEREMHQVYRVSSSEDVESGSINLTISQGPIEAGPIIRQSGGEDFAFLEIFGLDDIPNDDRLDAARIWRPATSGGLGVVTGSYLVFPTLQPFLDPPPILSLDAPFPLADADKNADIYQEPIDLIRKASFRYRLNLEYRARSSGRASSFSLGAIGIREDSDRVTLDGRDLERGRDYTIDYEIGQLQILRPGELFGGSQNPQLEIRFEQKPIFQIQPTSITALTGQYSFGDIGAIDFVGLLQREGSVLTRPELGLEPSAVSLGGIIGNFEFESGALDRLVNSLPGISTAVPSRVTFDGEIVGSSPTTNRKGTTFIDDFEGTSRLALGLSARAWRYGSVASRPDETGGFMPILPNLLNQLSGAWQEQWLEGQLVRGPLLTVQIDPAIRTQNPGSSETVLWISLDDAPSAENGWLSLTQPLSETGLDLTAVEFLEFYASTLGETSESLAMIIDIGTVSEDALVADSLGLPAGVGVLDQEADPIVGIWGNQDDTGLWSQACVSETSTTAFPLGDARANCTNNNGREDTEDLNRDSFLNLDERYLRYIVPLTVPSRFLDRVTGGEFQFNRYRVPLQLPDLVENFTIDGRQNVKHIRITFTSDAAATVLVSRMAFSGSPWLKRGGSGNLDGFVGDIPGTGGQVSVGPISTTDGDYVSPPGITDQQADLTDDLTVGAQPINEQSLRLSFEDIPAGERIEVFRRFTERPRNFLLYRRLRAWAIPVEGEFGPGQPLRFFVRLGFDANNFYLYRTELQTTVASPTRNDWLPERTVDVDRWLQLRVEAEQRLIDAGSTLPPDSSLIVWDVDVFPDGDSTLAVVISDRSRAPNLSAIREMAIGVQNVGLVAAGPGQVWIDDLRLDDAADEAGSAFRAGIAVALGDIIQLDADFSRRNPFYRQLGVTPTFQTDKQFSGRARTDFGRFLPDGLGLSMPIEFRHRSTSSDPFFLVDTDLIASRIDGLRTPESSNTSWSVAISKQTQSENRILRATLDGLRLGYSRQTFDQQATQTETSGQAWNASAQWARPVADASIAVLPGFLRSALDGLPGFISNSTVIQNLKDLRFRYTPRSLSLGGNLTRSTTDRQRFLSSVSSPGDTAITPTIDRLHQLSPRAGFQLQPFPSLVAGVDVTSIRDLIDPSLRVTGDQAIQSLASETGSFFGFGVGWESTRSVSSNISYQPEFASWFDPRLTVNTTYLSNRNASYIVPTEAGDTVLVRDLRLGRDMALDVNVRPSDLMSIFGVPPARTAEGLAGDVRDVWDRINPIRVTWSRSVSATYDRRELDPSFGDQLVLAGFDHLRALTAADTASTATSRDRFSLRGGYQLPLNLSAEANYSNSETGSFTSRSERITEETEWPSVQLRWRNVPVPGPIRGTIRNLMLTGGWREINRETFTLTGQNQGSETLTRSLSMTVVFVNGFNLSYQFDNSQNDRTDASGSSQADRDSHGFRGTGIVSPPGFLAFVKQPLRLSAELTVNGNASCRELGGGGFDSGGGVIVVEDCVAHLDQTTQNLSFTADSDFSGYSLGVQFLWVRRASDVGTRLTTNQYNFNIFGRFFLRTSTRELPPLSP
ncbi:MAG: hypothetical protein E2O48_03445 [Gemmatimonadetes bacterium]|nr:MAG: hypothetical protein E2O48_03445 [Gemmatimonadota bacterium]